MPPMGVCVRICTDLSMSTHTCPICLSGSTVLETLLVSKFTRRTAPGVHACKHTGRAHLLFPCYLILGKLSTVLRWDVFFSDLEFLSCFCWQWWDCLGEGRKLPNAAKESHGNRPGRESAPPQAQEVQLPGHIWFLLGAGHRLPRG